MQADRLRALTEDIEVFADILSRKDRSKKNNGEEYSNPEIYIYSEAVASVVYQKNNGEKCLALFY